MNRNEDGARLKAQSNEVFASSSNERNATKSTQYIDCYDNDRRKCDKRKETEAQNRQQTADDKRSEIREQRRRANNAELERLRRDLEDIRAQNAAIEEEIRLLDEANERARRQEERRRQEEEEEHQLAVQAMIAEAEQLQRQYRLQPHFDDWRPLTPTDDDRQPVRADSDGEDDNGAF